jgi:co-chaperonin GroES (HSP10)
MKLEPTNRHILVKPIKKEKQEQDSIIVLPQDYEKPQSPYKLCEVLETSGDSKFFGSLKKQDTIVVEQRMLQKIEVEQNEFYLILENYVLGRIK